MDKDSKKHLDDMFGAFEENIQKKYDSKTKKENDKLKKGLIALKEEVNLLLYDYTQHLKRTLRFSQVMCLFSLGLSIFLYSIYKELNNMEELDAGTYINCKENPQECIPVYVKRSDYDACTIDPSKCQVKFPPIND